MDSELLERGSRAILDKSIASVGATGIDVTPMLVEGEPAPVLTQVATGADLLVVGSRGYAGFTGRVLGSVSQRCIESATCPVVVVPHDAKPRTRTIVVGVDGSKPSCAALRWAIAEATRRRTRLEVVNAYHETQVVLPFGPATTSEHERLEQTSTSLLDHMIAEATGRAGPPQIETISSPLGAAAALRGLGGDRGPPRRRLSGPRRPAWPRTRVREPPLRAPRAMSRRRRPRRPGRRVSAAAQSVVRCGT